MIGTEISHYKIESEIGRGGMGIVYKAKDLTLGRTVAMKFLPPSHHANDDAQTRFMHEAQSISALDHPNIAVVHEIGETADERLYIVMGYYTGETLEDIIERGPLDVDLAVSYAKQIASGLQAAHEKGITHRDIKPGNVIVTESGLLKILDFGLAKVEDVTMTALNVSVGTPAYLSPEQSIGDPFDHRVDLWALGVVMYEMLVGSRPFQGAYSSALAYAVVNEPHPDLRDRRPEVPEGIVAIVDKLLQKDPNKRFRTAAEVAGAFRIAAPGTATVGGPVSSTGVDSSHAAAARSGPASQPNPTLLDSTGFAIGSEPRMIAGFPRRVIAGFVVAVVLVGLGFLARHFLLPGSSDSSGASQITESVRDQAREYLQAGIKYLGEGQYSLALAELERSVTMDSTYSPAWSSIAAAYLQLRDFDAAVSAANRALAIDSTNDGAYYNLGFALSSKGSVGEAIQAFSEAVRVNPGFTRAYSAWGDLLNEEGRPTEALDVLGRALSAPTEAEYRFLIYKNIGKAHMALGEYGEAIDNLEPALNLQPDWPETNWLLARSYEETGRIEEAKDRYAKYIAIENDPRLRKRGRDRLAGL